MNSPLLKGLVKANLINKDVAEWAERFPTPQLQSEALHQYRDEMARIKDKIEAQILNPPSPPLPKGGERGDLPAGSASAAPHGLQGSVWQGRMKTALRSMERYGAWDLFRELETWMGENVPPYRYSRKVFSWLCTIISVESMLAVMISLTLVFFGFKAVVWTGKWVWRESRGAPRENLSLPLAQASRLPLRGEGTAPTANSKLPIRAQAPVAAPASKPAPISQTSKQRVSSSKITTDSPPSTAGNDEKVASPAPKPGLFRSFTKNLLKNADATIMSAIPMKTVANGVVATKNAALTTSNDSTVGQ